MQANNYFRVGVTVLCVGALVAGCGRGDTSDPGSGPGSSGQTSAASAPGGGGVDPASLDTGSYPTEPAPAYPKADKDTVVDVEGQRLAEFVVVPFEIDPQLIVSKPGMGTVLRSGGALKAILNDESAAIASENQMLYGFHTAASSPTATTTDPENSLVHAVLRFETPEKAADAAARMHGVLLRDREQFGATQRAETRVQIPGHPETLATSTESAGMNGMKTVSVNSFTAHGPYLLYTWTSAPTGQEAWTTSTISRAVDVQRPLVDRFPATPTKAQNGGVSPEFPQIDQGRILIYAIPDADPRKRSGEVMAAYGPRGMAHTSTNPPLTLRTLTETGSQHNAVYKTTVYRAGDEAGARRILDEWVNDLSSQGYTVAPGPRGLPDARCVSKVDVNGTKHYCHIRVGRYVAGEGALEAKSSPDAKKDLDQLISAQYLILTKADQNA